MLALGLAAGASVLSAQPQRGFGWAGGMMGPDGGPGMMGPGGGYMGRGVMGMGCPMLGFGGEDEQAGSFVDGRIAFIKAELNITDAQQGAWDDYVQAAKANFESMRGMHQQMRLMWEAKSPVERLDGRIAAMEARLSGLKDMKPAVGKLYDALDGRQRETADALLTSMGCMM
jgi:hypothetical protein